MVLEVAQWKCRSVATVTRTIISPIALSALLIYPRFCYTDSLVNRKANRKYSLTINTGFRIGCSYARYLISTAVRLLTRIEIYASQRYNININISIMRCISRFLSINTFSELSILIKYLKKDTLDLHNKKILTSLHIQLLTVKFYFFT